MIYISFSRVYLLVNLCLEGFFKKENFRTRKKLVPGTMQLIDSSNQAAVIINESMVNNFTIIMRLYWSVRPSSLDLILIFRRSWIALVSELIFYMNRNLRKTVCQLLDFFFLAVALVALQFLFWKPQIE